MANIEIFRQIVQLELPHPDQVFRCMLTHDRRRGEVRHRVLPVPRDIAAATVHVY